MIKRRNNNSYVFETYINYSGFQRLIFFKALWMCQFWVFVPYIWYCFLRVPSERQLNVHTPKTTFVFKYYKLYFQDGFSEFNVILSKKHFGVICALKTTKWLFFTPLHAKVWKLKMNIKDQVAFSISLWLVY